MVFSQLRKNGFLVANWLPIEIGLAKQGVNVRWGIHLKGDRWGSNHANHSLGAQPLTAF